MNSSRRRFLLFLLAWGVAAALAGHFRLLQQLPRFATPLVLSSLIAGFFFSTAKIEWMREGLRSLSVRTIVAAHLGRFLGAYFLWLGLRGRVPAEFAALAGWGDIIAASGALALVFLPQAGAEYRWPFLAWNVIGAADLLIAIGTGGLLNVLRPGSMIELSSLPLAIVPLWLVPVLLVSHVRLIQRTHGSVPSPRPSNSPPIDKGDGIQDAWRADMP